jgi:hypothetical protein
VSAQAADWSKMVERLLPLIVCVLCGFFATGLLKPWSLGRVGDVILGLVGGYFLYVLTYPKIVSKVDFCCSWSDFVYRDVVRGVLLAVAVAVGALAFLYLARLIATAWGQAAVIGVAVVLALAIVASYVAVVAQMVLLASSRSRSYWPLFCGCGRDSGSPMGSSAFTTWILALALACFVRPAAAQSYEPVTAAKLLQNPSSYIGRPIELTNAYCASADAGGYECTTTEPLIVRANTVATPQSRKIIDDECGGMDAIEQTPTCRFNLRFVPTAVTSEQGSYKRGSRQVPTRLIVIQTDSLVARR